ncbi:hypothetical protein [Arthrobacter sp. OV608]|uniref:hypothetical protein n=1 Tax=Arthrobacter sp. OV608 TaxID=1882768 RepID=UPI0008D0E55B|nr:hypothetical protein [Arthrobacter sp. OV608]SEQ79093.1 hypothetical protein SAMN05444745_11114 [Arthrobacter sp. OV608]
MSSATEILELRVHGVRNTPPNEMLCVEPGEVVPAEGNGIKLVDKLAGFYRIKTPPPDSPTTVEAYSWGKLDRFAPAGLIGKTSRALYNIGWFLIAPFGLANVAYWGRVLKADDRREDGVDPGTGAALVRLFSLLLTLLLASAVATASMDLIAVQCFRVREDGIHQMCNNLPHWFDGLRQLRRGQRLAAVSPLPIFAVALLALISLSSDVRFRTRFRDQLRVPPTSSVAGRWQRKRLENMLKDSFVLAAPRLWIRRNNSPTGVLHVAATIQLMAFLLAADLMSISSGEIRAWSTAVLVFSCVVLAGTTWIVMAWGAMSVRAPSKDKQPSDDGQTGTPGWSRMALAIAMLIFSTGLYLWAVGNASTADGLNETVPFTASQLMPTVLVALLTILATSGCFMRLGKKAAQVSGSLIGLFGVAGLVIVLLRWSTTPIPVSAAFGLCVLCTVAVATSLLSQGERLPTRPLGRKAEAWYGMGPAAMMFLSLLLAAVYASAIVVGVGNWLQSGTLLWQQSTEHPLFRDLIKDDALAIRVPFLYWASGGVMVLVVLAAVLLLGSVMLLSQGRGQWITDPAVDDAENRYEREIWAVRRRSALLQRGEPVVFVAAAATGVGVVLVLTLTILHENGEGHQWLQQLPNWAKVARAGTWMTTSALTAAGLLIIGTCVASAAKGADRPLGLLWDLVAWLPRAGHPFGPACYSERAVPELADRIIQWLTNENMADNPAEPKVGASERRILLATHSLGGVLGIAALYHLAANGWGHLLPQIRLLTFGVQLRPYFGRFFPDLLGPIVLGTPGVMSPKVLSPDPWKRRDLPTPSGLPPDAPHAQLVNLLRTDGDAEAAKVWLNIWRRTDYLGFPVTSYAEPDARLDLTALEIEPDSYQALVATHGNYFRTVRYTEARNEFLQQWETLPGE